jgi:hypothetical protein
MDRKLRVGRCFRTLQQATIIVLRLGGVEASAATASVSPNAISNLYSGAVTLGIGGLTNGEAVFVERFIDVNTNGAVNAVDVRLDTVPLVDGQAAVIGGVTNINQPFDLNPTGGVISASFAFHRVDLARLTGRYIFRVSSPTGRFAPVSTVLRITNSALAQSVTGRVRSSGTNVSYGLVGLLPVNGEGGLVAGAVANSNGLFTIRAGRHISDGGCEKRVHSGFRERANRNRFFHSVQQRYHPTRRVVA